MSRPQRVLTEQEIIEVGALAQFLSKGQIADYLGISRPTFDAILERDEEAALSYRKGRSNAILGVSKGLVRQALNGNMTAAIFYLKTQAGWSETQVVDTISSDGSGAPTFNIVGVKPDAGEEQ